MKKLLLLVIFILVASFSFAISNPAADFCKSQGNTYEIKKDAEGNEVGICISDDGTETDEWTFYENNKMDLNKRSASSEIAQNEKSVQIEDDQIYSLLLRSKEKVSKTITEDHIAALPSSFDWRNNNGNWLTLIKNQGSCGSCWAFSAVGVVESRINLDQNDPDYDIDLSEQYLVSCSDAGSCIGGDEGEAIEYMQSDGTVRESCFPYKESDVPCSNKCTNWQDELVKVLSYDIVSASEIAIKQAIVNNGPITTYMVVCGDFNGNGI